MHEQPWKTIDWDFEEKLDAIVGEGDGPDDPPIVVLPSDSPYNGLIISSIPLLKVCKLFLLDERLTSWLAANDPKALRQVAAAVAGANMSTLPGSNGWPKRKTHVLACPECKSVNVDEQMWVDVNTNEVGSETGNYRYCNNCEENGSDGELSYNSGLLEIPVEEAYEAQEIRRITKDLQLLPIEERDAAAAEAGLAELHRLINAATYLAPGEEWSAWPSSTPREPDPVDPPPA